MSEGIEAERSASTLRQDLLTGVLSPEKFLREIFLLDQQDRGRAGARDNLIVLNDPQVRAKFENTELWESYCNLISLTYFHIGQRAILHEDDFNVALESFKMALEWAQKIDNELYEWRWYAEGTVAYLNSDLPRLKTAFSKVESQENKNILARFIKRIESGQSPNYKEDYNSKPL